MFIGFDASRAFVENRTGTENYSFGLLKALAKNDTENKNLLWNSVDKILPHPRRTLRFADAKRSYLIYIRPDQESIVGSEEWPENFQFKIISYKYLWTQLGLAIRTFIDPLDVLFVPAHTLPLIRKPGVKTVITVHDLGAEYLPGFHKFKQVLYLKLMTYYQLKSATKIIAVSKSTKKDLVKKTGIKSEKIKVVYEGIGEKFLSEKLRTSKIDAQRDILKQYGLEKKKYFLFVGTIQPRKNLKRLITAFKKFLDSKIDHEVQERLKIADERLLNKKNKKSLIIDHKSLFKLVLVGGKGWKSESIYSLPKELGIEDRVCFLGHVPDQDLVYLYVDAVSLTYPSLFEGFGLPILEAFACKCPVITSNISSMPEIAGDAGLLVNPENEEDIYKALVKITSDDILRRTLIQKGLDRLKKFSWEKTARETVEILMEVGKQK